MYQKSNEREEKVYAPQQIVQVHTMQNQRLSAQKQFEYVNVCVLLAQSASVKGMAMKKMGRKLKYEEKYNYYTKKTSDENKKCCTA